MGKSNRNKNKDKDAYVGPAKSRRRDSDSDDSDASAVTYDDDMQSIMGGVEDMNDVYDQLVDNLDLAQEKNPKSRTEGLHRVNLALTAKPAPEFIARNKETLISLCSRIGNKPDGEATMLATLMGLVAVQTGGEISELIAEPMAQMRTILMDASRDVFLRTACANSLAILTRLCCEEDEEVSANVKACRFAWANTKASSTSANLIGTALAAWCIILIDGDCSSVNSAIADQPKVATLLGSDQLEVRLAAAEALAFLHEFLEDARPGFRFPNKAHVLELLDGMVADSSKKKTKKDKRIQRYAIRDIRAFIADEDEAPSVSVKIGQQTLSLDTCAEKMFYDMVCGLLHGGLAMQLKQNEVLRDIFGLGSVPLEAEESINKQARLAVHDAADKYRKQVRGKQRDKRSAVY
uniref:Interferon-related developmental regulator N-terminal domain-containing protein n=1 Tax=Caenorhabditis japonica TaxID=281687 RepID=A0A8R1HNX4_CAEJA